MLTEDPVQTDRTALTEQTELTVLTGINGTNGTNGVDGVSVTGATINDEGKLVLTLSNGQEIVVGNVVGPAGQNAEGGR